MTVYQRPTALSQSLDALRKDLLRDDGPRISSVRNYNFAILPYDPEDEFTVRAEIHRLCEELRAAGWITGNIPLHTLMLARIRALGPEFIDVTINRELDSVSEFDTWKGLRTLKDRIIQILEGPKGLAGDVVAEIDRILSENEENTNRVVIFLGRTGALYPFFRTSALLKDVAGRTHNVPVVLLYPGKVIGETGLSFMGVLPADRDYRPRIYR